MENGHYLRAGVAAGGAPALYRSGALRLQKPKNDAKQELVGAFMDFFTFAACRRLRWHRGCFWGGMMDLALSVLALVAGGFALELYSSTWTALGRHDQAGGCLRGEVYQHPGECPSEKLG